MEFMKTFRFIQLLASITFLISLILSCQQERIVRFGICSDVHLPTMHDAGFRIGSFIDSMIIAKPDFIIELGDFGTPDPKYAPYFDMWNTYPGPRYHVIGNHEMDGGTSLETALAYRQMESAYYSFMKNGYTFIVLDGNNKKTKDQRRYGSFIGQEQLTWLTSQLQTVTGPVVIFSHQGIGSDPGIPGERYSIDNDEQVRALFDRHNKQHPRQKVIACFNGHTHHDAAENINGIWYITINSMAYKWLGEEYAHIRYSNEVDSLFKWIKYTAPYKDPLYSVVTISNAGLITISGKYSTYVGPTPWELGYPDHLREVVKPQISERQLPY